MKKLFLLVLMGAALSSYAQTWTAGTGILYSNPTTTNIGIGTTNPQCKLDVAGMIKTHDLQTSRISAYTDLGFTYDEKFLGDYSVGWYTDSWHVGSPTLWQSGYAGIKFFTTRTLRMAIKSNGNVGIGTDNPQCKLDVAGRAKTVDLQTNRVAAYFDYNFTYDGKSLEDYSIGWYSDSWHVGSPTLWQSGYAGIKFFTTRTLRMAIKSDGNVGIGTDNPLQKLHVVNGNILMSRTATGGAPGSANGMMMFGGSDVGVNGETFGEWGIEYLNTPQDGYGLNFCKVWTNLGGFNYGLFLANNGNVGIGEKNPQSKLAVNGTIRAREVLVTLSGWSDFVFASDYKLLSLSEVEQFIKQNKHLPEIPSAKEVEENGISLGEMQAKLLQKIEELMLYTIEQQKLIEELQKQLKELQQKANDKGGE